MGKSVYLISMINYKKELIEDNTYIGKERYQLAYDFGTLLSYSEEAIERMISENTEKEE